MLGDDGLDHRRTSRASTHVVRASSPARGRTLPFGASQAERRRQRLQGPHDPMRCLSGSDRRSGARRRPLEISAASAVRVGVRVVSRPVSRAGTVRREERNRDAVEAEPNARRVSDLSIGGLDPEATSEMVYCASWMRQRRSTMSRAGIDAAGAPPSDCSSRFEAVGENDGGPTEEGVRRWRGGGSIVQSEARTRISSAAPTHLSAVGQRA